jgi:hypothetical protein
MATRLQPGQLQNLQQVEAAVSGPDGANRLFTVTGQTTNLFVNAFSQGAQTNNSQTFTALVGPTFTRQQFIRAICTSSVAQTSQHIQVVPGDFSWGIVSSDADWDDESGQVELRVEVNVSAGGNNNSATLNSFSFDVTILAAVAA